MTTNNRRNSTIAAPPAAPVLPEPLRVLREMVEEQIAHNLTIPAEDRVTASGKAINPYAVPFFAKLEPKGRGFADRVKARLGINAEEYALITAAAVRANVVVSVWSRPGCLTLPQYSANGPVNVITAEKSAETTAFLNSLKAGG